MMNLEHPVDEYWYGNVWEGGEIAWWHSRDAADYCSVSPFCGKRVKLVRVRVQVSEMEEVDE